MKSNKLTLALIGAGIVLAQPALAHVANIDIGSGNPSIAGDAPDYLVYTPSVQTANGASTYTLKASVVNPIPAGFTGDPGCPLGGNQLDLTDPANPVEILDSVTGQPIACNYTAAGLDQFSANAWAQGATKSLGDSHALHGGAFFTFTLAQKSTVTITLAKDLAYTPADGLPNALDAAFTLYEHTLPSDGHDDNAYDLLQPTGADGYYTASATDKAFGDPGVPAFIWDATTGTGTANKAFTNKVRAKYQTLYPANGSYRDTQNYTATGGLDVAGIAVSPVPGQSPYVGQFNALGNWSVANDVPDSADPANDPIKGANIRYQGSYNLTGAKPTRPIYDGTRALVDPVTGEILWSEIRYLKAVNANSGKKAGSAENLTVTLQPGDYTIAAGDAGAATGRLFGGVLSVKIK